MLKKKICTFNLIVANKTKRAHNMASAMASKSKKRSFVWNFFDETSITVNEKRKKTTKCSKCGKTFSFLHSTSPLVNHLRNKHGIVEGNFRRHLTAANAHASSPKSTAGATGSKRNQTDLNNNIDVKNIDLNNNDIKNVDANNNDANDIDSNKMELDSDSVVTRKPEPKPGPMPESKPRLEPKSEPKQMKENSEPLQNDR